MNKKELDKFKKELLEKRADILRTISDKKERDLRDVEVGDEIDSASQQEEKEMFFEVTDSERSMLDAIEAALRRIDKGTFGQCESCRGKVSDARLKALPWVRYCINCQSNAEKPSR
jgi:DnaK suppressor protein